MFLDNGEDEVAIRGGRFQGLFRIMYFFKKNVSCGQSMRHLRARALLRRHRLNFCYRTRQRRVSRRKHAPNTSHRPLISEILIFAMFSASGIQKDVGCGLLMAPCFSANVEKHLLRFLHSNFGLEKNLRNKDSYPYMCIYIYKHI